MVLGESFSVNSALVNIKSALSSGQTQLFVGIKLRLKGNAKLVHPETHSSHHLSTEKPLGDVYASTGILFSQHILLKWEKKYVARAEKLMAPWGH